jgi:putative peptide zinc metalloprotease protein
MILLMKRLVRIAIVGLAAAVCLWFVRTDLKVAGEFRILPLHNADVRADVDGIIEQVLHDEGDPVDAGSLIVRLSDRDYRPELDKISAEIAEKDAHLKMLRTGARAEEIELARTALRKTEERVKFSQDNLQIEESLYADKLSSKKDYQAAEELAAVRHKEMEEARASLQLLLAGCRPEEIEATQAEINRLAAMQKYLQEQVQRLRITTPIAGVITTHRLADKLGATVKKGDLIAEVHQLKTVNAEIVVPEKEISEVRVGQRVLLKARAHIGASFEGKVTAISPVASKSAEGQVQHTFLVVTELDNTAGLLKSEMSGNAKIYCGVHRLYEIVFRRLIRFVRVEFWSWW